MGLWGLWVWAYGYGVYGYGAYGYGAYGYGVYGVGGPSGASRGVITCAEHKSIAQKVT